MAAPSRWPHFSHSSPARSPGPPAPAPTRCRPPPAAGACRLGVAAAVPRSAPRAPGCCLPSPLLPPGAAAATAASSPCSAPCPAGPSSPPRQHRPTAAAGVPPAAPSSSCPWPRPGVGVGCRRWVAGRRWRWPRALAAADRARAWKAPRCRVHSWARRLSCGRPPTAAACGWVCRSPALAAQNAVESRQI